MKRYLPFFIAFLLFIVVAPIIYIYGRQAQELRSRAAPASTISYSPNAITKDVTDGTFEIDVVVNSGDDPATNNKVTGADLIITYNKDAVDVTDIVAGSFFPDPSQVSQIRKTIDAANGQISYSFFTLSANAGQGQGVLAKITLQPKAAGTSQLTFVRPDTKLIGYSEDTDVLLPDGVSGATINITSGGSSPTETPTPTQAASGATNTPTPTTPPGATNTLTPSPTRTPTPSPTTGPGTPTVTPAPTNTSAPTSTPGSGGTNINPTATPTTSSSSSGTGGGSSLAISSPASGSTVYTSRPTFRGTATPGSTVTIVIYSEPITGTTVANSSGVWSYTPSVALADGSHTVTLTEQTTGGSTNTLSSSITVQTSDIPVTGSVTTTWLLIGLASLLLLGGLGMFYLPK